MKTNRALAFLVATLCIVAVPAGADEMDPEEAELLEWQDTMNAWLEAANKGEKYEFKEGRRTLGPINTVGIELSIDWPSWETAYRAGERLNLATFCGYFWTGIKAFSGNKADTAKIKKMIKSASCVWDEKETSNPGKPPVLKKGVYTFYVSDHLGNLHELHAEWLKKSLKLKTKL